MYFYQSVVSNGTFDLIETLFNISSTLNTNLASCAGNKWFRKVKVVCVNLGILLSLLKEKEVPNALVYRTIGNLDHLMVILSCFSKAMMN